MLADRLPPLPHCVPHLLPHPLTRPDLFPASRPLFSPGLLPLPFLPAAALARPTLDRLRTEATEGEEAR